MENPVLPVLKVDRESIILNFVLKSTDKKDKIRHRVLPGRDPSGSAKAAPGQGGFLFVRDDGGAPSRRRNICRRQYRSAAEKSVDV